MVRSPVLFISNPHLNWEIPLVHQKERYTTTFQQGRSQMRWISHRGQQRPEVKHHSAFNHNGFQIAWAGHRLVPLHLSFYASLCSLSEVFVLLNVAGHSVLIFLVTQVREMFHLIRSHMSAPVLWVDLFIISISLSQSCRVFFCQQQQQHICTLCACYSFSWMSKPRVWWVPLRLSLPVKECFCLGVQFFG